MVLLGFYDIMEEPSIYLLEGIEEHIEYSHLEGCLMYASIVIDHENISSLIDEKCFCLLSTMPRSCDPDDQPTDMASFTMKARHILSAYLHPASLIISIESMGEALAYTLIVRWHDAFDEAWTLFSGLSE
jgi:hypothetical protein